MSLHRFDPEIAKFLGKNGVNAAIIFENLCHWTRKNEANSKHFYDGKTWTYNSISAFVKLFPYLSSDQIRGAIKKLKKAGLIETGNYNKKGYDRTLWYSVKIPHDLVKIPNGIGENPKPIPDNKPYNKLNTHIARANSFPKNVYEAWNVMAAKHGLSQVKVGLKNINRDKRLAGILLRICSGDESLLFDAIDKVPKNPHWIGQTSGNFRADFDWIFRSSQLPKVLEYIPKDKYYDQANNQYRDPSRIAGDNRRSAGLAALEEHKAKRMAKGV